MAAANAKMCVHTIDNSRAKYEHPWSNNKRGVHIKSYNTYLINLTLTLDPNVIPVIYSLL